ncbi:HAD-IA family hydrolase [Kineococcus arenarius]|uniref:HAD-IA family hydrolase n=1 Tax=unclassified Kineococcus TaxID=2621656 RepID=UPI003D7E7153
MVTPTATRAVLFDADGVLVDSHAGYRNVWQRWSQLHRLDPVVVLAATHARRPVDTVAEVAPHLDAVAEYARLVDYVNELPGAFPVFPDAGDLLALLAPERWAVVTSGDADRVRERLRAGALPVPRIVVDGQAVRRGKPDPEGYLLAAEKLQVRPGDCLVVEDAPAGVEAARAAGMTVLALTTSHPVSELQRADVVVDSLRQAQPMLVEWMAGAAPQRVGPGGVNVTDG